LERVAFERRMPSLASIPSPPWNALHLGPLQVHFYGLMIALGVVAAVALANRRFVARGGAPGEIGGLALRAVPAGVIGAPAVPRGHRLRALHPPPAPSVRDLGAPVACSRSTWPATRWGGSSSRRMRIDFAHTIAGLRVNEWISVFAFGITLGFVWAGRAHRTSDSEPSSAAVLPIEVTE
jgi:hypothetical protein